MRIIFLAQYRTFWLASSCVVFVITWMITHPQSSFSAALHAVALWWQWIAPLLFPAMFFSALLQYTLHPILRDKKAVIGSMFILGFPASYLFLRDCYEKSYISKEQLERYASTIFIQNPLWLSAILILYARFTSFKHALAITICYVCAISVTLLFNWQKAGVLQSKADQRTSIGTLLSSSSRLAGSMTMTIGSVTLFMSVITAIFVDVVAQISNHFTLPFIYSLIDMQPALIAWMQLAAEESDNTFLLVYGPTALMLWGGFAAHLVVKILLYQFRISYQRFLVWRLTEMVVALPISIISVTLLRI